MSNLSERYSHTRRRHNPHSHHIDLSENINNFQPASLIGVSSVKNLNNQNTKAEPKQYSNNLNSNNNNSSFSNLSSLIGVSSQASLNQFWNTAQVKIKVTRKRIKIIVKKLPYSYNFCIRFL